MRTNQNHERRLLDTAVVSRGVASGSLCEEGRLYIGCEGLRFCNLVILRDRLHQIAQFTNRFIGTGILPRGNGNRTGRAIQIQQKSFRSGRCGSMRGICVDRQKLVRLFFIRDGRAFGERDKGIVGTRQDYLGTHT